MKRRKVLLLALITVFMVLVYFCHIYINENSVDILAKNGELDLHMWDMQKAPILQLEGEWRYYPNILKTPGENILTTSVRNIPETWKSDSGIHGVPYGMASYELKVKGLIPGKIYGLDMPDQVTAYELYINENKVAGNGIVGSRSDKTAGEWRPMVAVFTPNERGEALFLMRISNYEYFRGGFWNSIKLGSAEKIINLTARERTLELFLFTSVFTIGFFYLCYYIIYRNNQLALYFSLFCLIVAFYNLEGGRRILLDVLPNVDFGLFVRSNYLLGYLLLPIFGLFVLHLYHDNLIQKKLRHAFYLYIIGVTIGMCILPNSIYSMFMEPYKWICGAFGIYFLALMFQAVKKKRENTEIMFLGILGILVALAQETFLRGPVSWLPAGALCFAICFAIVTMKKFMDAVRRGDVLETKVLRDALTGVYNRNYLVNLQERMIHLNKRIFLLFLDLDNFKIINDTYGHKTGDLILQEVGRRLEHMMSGRDALCRYGGDEFIVISEAISENEICEKAGEIITKITEPYEIDGKSYALGLSIGITERKGKNFSMEELIRRSDQAMYESKKAGGNCYTLAG